MKAPSARETVSMLESIRCPADVRGLPAERLPALAAEIRRFLLGVERIVVEGAFRDARLRDLVARAV